MTQAQLIGLLLVHHRMWGMLSSMKTHQADQDRRIDQLEGELKTAPRGNHE